MYVGTCIVVDVSVIVKVCVSVCLCVSPGSSGVYVSVVAEREKSQSPFLPPSTAPLWQFTARM